MAKNETVFFTKEGRYEVNSVAIGAATTVLFTAGPDGSKLYYLGRFDGGGSGFGGTYKYWDGTTEYPITEPFSGTALADEDILALLPTILDKSGNAFVNLPPNAEIRITATSNVGAWKTRAYTEDY